MSYGFRAEGDFGQLLIDGEHRALCVVADFECTPGLTKPYNYSSILPQPGFFAFPKVVTTQEPPVVFFRPVSGDAFFYPPVIGGVPGAWTGVYLLAAYAGSSAGTRVRVVAAAPGPSGLVGNERFGIQVFGPQGELVFDSRERQLLYRTFLQGKGDAAGALAGAPRDYTYFLSRHPGDLPRDSLISVAGPASGRFYNKDKNDRTVIMAVGIDHQVKVMASVFTYDGTPAPPSHIYPVVAVAYVA